MKISNMFDVEKANELLTNYRKKLQFSKASFLEELIYYQLSFGDNSILNSDLLLTRYYLKSTISSVVHSLRLTVVYPTKHTFKYRLFNAFERCIKLKS